MKRRNGVRWTLGLAATGSLVLGGCGGSTSVLFSDDDAGPADAAGPTGLVDGPGATGTGGDAAAPFNPGMLGGLVGGSNDGGAVTVGDSAASAQVVDGCTRLCTAEAAAACPASGSLQSCIVGCQLVVGNPSCAAQTQALFACVDGASATCDSSGNATFAGCAPQELETEACFLQNTTDPSLATPCATYCANVAAAKCPNDNPAGCPSACPVEGNLISGCGPAWKDYVTCANTSTLACGSDGKAAPAGCAAQGLTFLACAAAGLAPLVSDAGR